MHQLQELRLGSVGDGVRDINNNKFTLEGFKAVMAALKTLPELTVLEMQLPKEKVLSICKRSTKVGRS